MELTSPRTDQRVALEELARRSFMKKKMDQYRRDPLAWLKERFDEDVRYYKWSSLPEYEHHKWDGDVDPLANAWLSLAQRNWVGIESGSGTGKTYWLSRVAFWFLDCFENSLVVTSAPKLDQLRLHIWSEIGTAFGKFKVLRPEAELLTLRLKMRGEGESSWHAVGFVAGAEVDADSATKAQGFHRRDMLIITDETPGMNDSILTAFQNTSVGENNMILSVGNPDSEMDALHRFAKNPHVKTFRVSAFDHPNIVLNTEWIPGAVTNKSIKIKEDVYGVNSNFFLSRVRGICPTQSVNSLIRLEWIEQCINAEIPADDESYPAIGIDVANSESGDMACIGWGKGNKFIGIKEFQCPNASHLAYNVIYDDAVLLEKGMHLYYTVKMSELDVTADCIGVDSVGVGVSTVNAFLDAGHDVMSLQGGPDVDCIPKDDKGKPMYKFATLRAQMYWQLREDLRQKKISIQIDDRNVINKLKKNLIIPRMETAGGVIYVEKKEEIKRRMKGDSPNDVDALVYWNWVRRKRNRDMGSGVFSIEGLDD